ncbi:MAG: hypothetical protein RL885_02365 [Planctomycetota bacterium]
MGTLRSRLGLLAFLALAGAVSAQPATPAPPQQLARYTVTELAPLGGSLSIVQDLNGSGVAVGWATDASGVNHATRWQDGQALNLGKLPGDVSSSSDAINEAGDIVVTSRSPNNIQSACVWSQGVLTPLGALGGQQSGVHDIQGARVVGWAMVDTGTTRFHGYTGAGGPLANHGTFPGGLWGSALAINDAGVSVGYVDTNGMLTSASRYTPEEGQVLLPGFTELGSDTVSATDLNESGTIIGYAWTGRHYFDANLNIERWARQAVYWQDGILHRLGTIGGENSSALGINEAGVIVGWSEDDRGDLKAVLWQGGRRIVLEDRLVRGGAPALFNAFAINDQGQIAANGINASGQRRGFILTPVD